MTRRNILITTGLVLALVAFIVIRLMSNKQELDKRAAEAAIVNEKPTVRTLAVNTTTIDRIFTVNGKFEAVSEVKVMAETQGSVTQLNVREGANVGMGQTLLRIDAENLENELAITRETLTKAEQDLARYETLAAGGAAPSAQLEDLRLAIKSHQSRIKGLEIALKKTQVKAPISGSINVLYVEKGSSLMPGSPVADIVDISSLEMVVNLTEGEVIGLRTGARVEVRLDLYPDKALPGVVTFIGVKADMAGKFPVKVRVSNNGTFRAGMSGSVTFAFNESVTGIQIPREALVGSMQAPQVYVLTADNHLKLQPVTLSMETADVLIVKSGLTPGDRVVTSVSEKLADGIEVLAVN
ncbi:MAG: efflux RND transporter periplasmic adaptor subunit [Bacteroidia bacterium]|nr:efflux RND transporter periplasmic adaptor subunit [Bacteroidia bacterium]